MAVIRVGGPYVWVTWLTKLMVGEQSCEWAAWFRSQHEGRSWRKEPDSFRQAGWMVAHTDAINEARDQWESRGYTVLTEGQNSFILKGRSAVLGGKPDLIARKGGEGTIIDVKTGAPYASHIVQVMLYMYAVPKVLGLHGGVVFDGVVPDGGGGDDGEGDDGVTMNAPRWFQSSPISCKFPGMY